MADIPTSALVNGASGILLIALGLFVATLRPRRPGNLGLVATTAGSGLGFLLNNIGLVQERSSPAQVTLALLAIPCFTIAAFGILNLTRHFPSPLGRTERGVAIAAGTVAFVHILLGSWIPLIMGENGYIFKHIPIANALTFAGGSLFAGTLVGAAVLYGLRFRGADGQNDARAFALLSVSLAMYPLAIASENLRTLANPDPGTVFTPTLIAADVVVLGGPALLVVLWLVNTRGPHGGLARNAAWALLAVAFVCALPGVGDAAVGIARFVGVVILAFGILRGQLPGLDVKVRFALSKSTVAGVFVAVFFVASEVAQNFFGQTFGSAFAGIAAAGILVFAVSPLQRAAERLAAKAVPVIASEPPPLARPSSRAEMAYKAALRAAMRDGTVTRREEKHLAEVARALGIDPVDAHEWRDQVEAETPKAG